MYGGKKNRNMFFVFFNSENLIVNCIYLVQREIQQCELKTTISNLKRLWGI